MAMTPGARQDFLWQLRFIADHAIVAARLQRDRCRACPPGLDPRHDLDFYVLAVDRLVSCANKAATNCGVAAASAAKIRLEEAVLPACAIGATSMGTRTVRAAMGG